MVEVFCVLTRCAWDSWVLGSATYTGVWLKGVDLQDPVELGIEVIAAVLLQNWGRD